MITKQQALEFLYELSKEFKITTNLTGYYDSFMELYSDTAGTFHLDIEADSLEELVTKFIAEYINTNLFENIDIIPVDIDMLEAGKLYEIYLNDYYDGERTYQRLFYLKKEESYYYFKNIIRYSYKYKEKDFYTLYEVNSKDK